MDLGIYLVDDLLVKTDRASMAHSLEARVPFCDQVVAELALPLPTRQKVRGFAKKRLLRRAVAPLLPRAITHGKKQGFSIPVAAWPRVSHARQVLSEETIARQGYFRPGGVERPDRRPRRPAAGPQPPDLGPDGVDAVVDRYAAVGEPAPS